jgi:peptidoglycan/xylan/chitin deacetylase (PgdA/CDA1 family)
LDLTVGVVPQSSIYDEVLYEMLDHQGVAYRVIDVRHATERYPVVLLSKYFEDAHTLALECCASESDVIVAERVLPLDKMLSMLGGTAADGRDNFELAVNREEDRLLSTIREHLFRLGLPLVRKWYWPRGANACCVLTHDIDWFTYSPFHFQVLKQSANPLRLVRLTFDSLARKKDYGWNIPEMVKLEQEFGFKSTFFFQTAYGLDDPMLERSADFLNKEGFELALHGARTSYNDADSLRDEMQRFRSRTGVDTRGLRYHILKFDPPRTWELQSAAGLEYDATFYYNRFFGFRSGICFPYRPFSRDSRLPILELPTGYMDWTSLHRGQSAREQLETLETTRKAVEGYHGILVVNFHNTYLNHETFPNVYASFSALLKSAKQEGYWVATAQECANWWRLRASARIDPRLDSGDVVCSPTSLSTVVEREGSESQLIAPAQSP